MSDVNSEEKLLRFGFADGKCLFLMKEEVDKIGSELPTFKALMQGYPGMTPELKLNFFEHFGVNYCDFLPILHVLRLDELPFEYKRKNQNLSFEVWSCAHFLGMTRIFDLMKERDSGPEDDYGGYYRYSPSSPLEHGAAKYDFVIVNDGMNYVEDYRTYELQGYEIVRYDARSEEARPIFYARRLIGTGGPLLGKRSRTSEPTSPAYSPL